MGAKYDKHYAESAAACGEPFAEFAAMAERLGGPGVSVLDLGCGQGRDALLFARRGCRVVGIDLSSVGIAQLDAIAEREELDLQTVVGDVATTPIDGVFDVVVLDRVLHMLPSDEAMRAVLRRALDATAPGGHVLVADGPRNRPLIRAEFGEGWELVKDTENRTFARRR